MTLNPIHRILERRPSKLLDRLAARRMLAHAIGQLGAFDEWGSPVELEKSNETLIVEAWLWRRYGAIEIAVLLEGYVHD